MISDNTVISAPSSPSNLSSVTLVGSTGSGSGSGSDRSPQDGVTYSRGVSEDTDTPVATDPPKGGTLITKLKLNKPLVAWLLHTGCSIITFSYNYFQIIRGTVYLWGYRVWNIERSERGDTNENSYNAKGDSHRNNRERSKQTRERETARERKWK